MTGTIQVTIDSSQAKAAEAEIKATFDAMKASAADMRKGIDQTTNSLNEFRKAASGSIGAEIAANMELARKGLTGVAAASAEVVAAFKAVQAEGERLARLRGDLSVAMAGKPGGDFGAAQMKLANQEARLLIGQINALGLAEKVAADSAIAAAAAEAEAIRIAAAAKVAAAERVAAANLASLSTVHALANDASAAMARVDKSILETATVVGTESRSIGEGIGAAFVTAARTAKEALSGLLSSATTTFASIKTEANAAGASIAASMSGGIGTGRGSWLIRGMEAKTTNQALRDFAHGFQILIPAVIAYSAVHQTLKFAETAEQAEQLATRLHSLGTSFEALEPAAHAMGMSVEKSVKTFEALNEPIVAMGGSGKLATQVFDDLAKQLALAGVHGADAEARLARFGQVLANGFVSGRQFEKSLRDIPGLLEQLTRATGMSEQALKKAFVDQKLQSNLMVQAIVSDQERIQTEFIKSPRTLASATSEMADSWTKMLGKWAATPGAMEPIVGAVERLTNYLRSSDATANLMKIGNAFGYATNKAMDFGEWFSRVSAQFEKENAKNSTSISKWATETWTAFDNAWNATVRYFDGVVEKAVRAGAAMAAFGSALASLATFDGPKIGEAFAAIDTAGDDAVQKWRDAAAQQKILEAQLKDQKALEIELNAEIAMMGVGFDQAAKAAARMAAATAATSAAATSAAAAAGLKGIGEKKDGAGRSQEGAQFKLDLLQKEAELLRTEILGNGELTRQAKLELDIRKAIEPAVKAGNVQLVAAITDQMRINDELKKQVETYSTLKSLGTSIGDSISNSFMSIGDGTKKASDAMKQLAVDIIKAIVQATILKPLINQFSNGFAGALTPLFGDSLSSVGGGLLGGIGGGGGASAITAAGTSFATTVQAAASSFAATLTGSSTTAGASLTSSGATAGASLTSSGATTAASLTTGGATASAELATGGGTAGTTIAAGGSTAGITLTTAGATTGLELETAGAVTASEIEAAGAASAVSGGMGGGGGLASLAALFLANGGAFAGGNIVPYANGGAFGQSAQMFAKGDIFDRPTGFQYGGGKLGVLGEAGPEAIMPLRRAPGGGLGIVAHGGGSSNILPLVRGADGKMAVKMFADGSAFGSGGEASLGNGTQYNEAPLSASTNTSNASGHGASGTVIQNTFHLGGTASHDDVEQIVRALAPQIADARVAMAAPKIINQAVNSVQSKNRNDRAYLSRR